MRDGTAGFAAGDRVTRHIGKVFEFRGTVLDVSAACVLARVPSVLVQLDNPSHPTTVGAAWYWPDELAREEIDHV